MSRRQTLAAAAAVIAAAGAVAAIVLATNGGDDGGIPQEATQGQGQGDGQDSPEDIARQVEAGELTPEQAREIMRERAEAQETPREREARRVAEGVYEVLAEEQGDEDSTDLDGAAFCAAMSERARRQTVRYVRRSAGVDREWDCESAVSQLVLRSKRQGNFKPIRGAEVIGVNAEGDRATASIQFGNGTVSSVSLVREDGEWKLASPPPGG